ncbi:MAG: hypothetical protein ACRDZO_23055 [Egibacteraceae bacterium]
MTTAKALARGVGSRGLEVVCLVGMSLSFLWILALDYRLYDQLIMPVLFLAAVSLVAAGVVATRARWVPALGAAVAAVILFGAAREPFVLLRLTDPETVWTFLATILMLAFNLTALAAGIRATVRRA